MSMPWIKSKFNLILITFILGCGGVVSELQDKAYLLGLSNPSDFERPSILTISPFTSKREVSLDSTISILFSRPMNKISTEQGITIISNGGNTAGSFNWRNDYTLDITFKLGLSIGKRYEIKVNRALARDIQNNTLSKEFISDFYTIGFEDSPEISSAEPIISNSLVENWPIDRDIILNFSQPMNESETSLATSISGGPAVFLKEWSNNSTTLRLRLQSSLQRSTSYTIKVSTTAKSRTGVSLVREFSNSFYTGQVASPITFNVTPFPNSLAWTNVNPAPVLNEFLEISKFDSFRFTFNAAMERNSVERAITFSPNISGSFRWTTDQILEFIPNSPLTQETRYRLNFSANAQNSNGISVGNSYIIDFTSNNLLDSTAVQVTNIRGYSVSATCNPTLDANANAVVYPPDANAIYTTTITSTDCSLMDYMFEITFNTAGGCALKTNGEGDVFNQVTFSYFSGGPGGGTPSVYYKDYNPPLFCSTAGVYRIGIKSTFPNVQYKFSLAGGTSGIRDRNENFMTNSINFLFQRN